MLAKSTDRSVEPNSLPLAHRRIDAQQNDGRHRVPAAEYKITELQSEGCGPLPALSP